MIGIYALWFEESSMVYIGQSQNIEQRFYEHRYKLKNTTHTNYKVQQEYKRHGMPALIIIEKCSINELNDLEVAWTEEFDSINNGLNIIEAGQVGWGSNSNASKHNKIQILKVFSLLYNTSLNYSEIGDKCSVNRSLARDIKNGKAHLWLKEQYQDRYIKMRSRVMNTNHGYNTGFVKPCGSIIYISNIRRYCLDNNYDSETSHSFSSGLGRLRSGSRSSFKGWKLL